MKYYTLPLAFAAIAICMVSFDASASGWGNGGGNGNNNGPTTTNNDYSTNNNPVANGGAGGAGLGVGIGKGGNADANANAAAKSDAKSTANSVAAVNAKTGDVDTKQNTSVTIEGDEAPEIPVSSAYAAALTSANGTCMGSTSGGLQFMNTGATFGSTWMDADCDRRYDAATLKSLGLPEAAAALMCQKPEVRESMKRSLDPDKFAQLCEGSEIESKPAETASADTLAGQFGGKDWFKSTTGNICYAERSPTCVRP